ncbi:alpha/beta fold hydrolase [Caballeronia sp. BR00000012568055]|uniref:alpha/beta fold hydrolase n=1 Tax=Caballeronia sp. BR00000012568055 TaxID=2918761 RepID=UPI0023F9398C|nr:alpha/beta hydrolase [Caballeronia sp. BR00000012568055]
MTFDSPLSTDHLPDGFRHDTAYVEDLKLHYVTGGRPPGTAPLMLLIHGFPQNWWEWNRVLRPLGEHYSLIVPDLRGVGFSDKTEAGYTKKQLAADLYGLVRSIGGDAPHVVGHDIGAMVAYAYAWQFPTRTLTVLDASIPGVGDWEEIASSPLLFHFSFHQKRYLPEALICGGREHVYISSFINDRIDNAAAISAVDMAEYVRAYSHPGAFRAAMEMYRQFPQDVIDNRNAPRLPDSLPVLALGGDRRWGPHIVERMKAVADNVRGGSLPRCGHFLAEEQPELLVAALREFCVH